MGYTKGEWLMLNQLGNIEHIISEKTGKFICKFDLSKDAENWTNDLNEQNANAKLMASAPDLLEALIMSQKRIEILINLTPTGQMRNDLTDENIKILEAIKKATK